MRRRSVPSRPPFADLFGREAALARLGERFAGGARLVTLVGPPGVGKSRLAAAHLDTLRGVETAWIDLSGTTRPEELSARVAHELGLRPSWLDTPDLVDELGWALEGRGALALFFDESEHTAPFLGRVLARWLALSPSLRVLVTSRERLGVAVEAVVEVEPLDREAATALLAARAGLAPSAALAELAARLDGIPLALELVAARLSLLAPEAVLDRLAAGLDVIDEGRATLRDALAGSWARLAAEEAEALARLAVFEGSFRIEAAEAVIGEGALARLQALRDKSLLARSGARARLYAPVRAFAGERLDAATRADALRRHARFFAREAADA
ncbi:MAG: AAA family ATPase, partial [Sandaracinaceae bacterium]|nr:AAA family ATPase [Sandaracinaceae bacterium]